MASDRPLRYGQLNEPDRRVIQQALQEWAFFEEAEERQPLSDLIKVNQPLSNDDIDSPVKIEGKARGQWYFEGDCPVELQDKDDKAPLARSLENSYIPQKNALDYTHSIQQPSNSWLPGAKSTQPHDSCPPAIPSPLPRPICQRANCRGPGR